MRKRLSKFRGRKIDITKIDIVIANAGIFKLAAFQKVTDMKTSDLMKHFDVNATDVVRIFQARDILLLTLETLLIDDYFGMLLKHQTSCWYGS